MSEILQMIETIARQAGAVLMEGYGNVRHIQQKGAIDLVTEFSKSRQRLVDLLRNIKDEDLDKASVHPRLGTPMKVVDLAYFVAEHDDHHLAKITLLSQND